MTRISNVDRVEAFVLTLPGHRRRLMIAALGLASTSGWTHPRLSPYVYIQPPADGVWDFEFVADPPHGIVLPVLTPMAAAWSGPLPDWCEGVRIHAASNHIAAALAVGEEPVDFQTTPAFEALSASSRAAAGRAIIHQTLAEYDDSIQPTGTIHWDGLIPHVEMKKLRHRLVLTVEGPDAARIEDCIRQAATAGVIAAIAAAIATGGLGLTAALSAALSTLSACLGEAYTPRIEDQSHWIYWDT